MEDYAERIVDRAVDLGCQDAVADVSVNRSYQIRFAQNQIVISNQWRETSASVFLVYDKRVVASDIKDLTKLDAAMEGLVKVAKASQENPEYAGIAKGPFKDERLSFDKRIVDLADGSDHVQAAVNGGLGGGAPVPPDPAPGPPGGAIAAFSEVLPALKPDISLVYADRMEGRGPREEP